MKMSKTYYFTLLLLSRRTKESDIVFKDPPTECLQMPQSLIAASQAISPESLLKSLPIGRKNKSL